MSEIFSALNDSTHSVTGDLEEEVERLQAEVEMKIRMLEKAKGRLKEAVKREKAGSHDKQVGHREDRERGKCQNMRALYILFSNPLDVGGDRRRWWLRQ